MLSKAATSLMRTTATRSCRIPLAAASLGSVRNLNVHEHISMELMNEHGIATPQGYVAFTPEESEDIYANKMNNRTY